MHILEIMYLTSGDKVGSSKRAYSKGAELLPTI